MSVKRFGQTSPGEGDKGRQAPYKHQGGRGAWPMDPPTTGSIGPVPNPVGPANLCPPHPLPTLVLPTLFLHPIFSHLT